MKAENSYPQFDERSIQYGLSAQLNGILTRPTVEYSATRPCLVILNAGILHKTGPNRLHVRLAREASQNGLAAFRFDFAGVGDSPPRNDGKTLADGVLIDIAETLDLLEAKIGAKRFILAGLCSGADNSLRAARRDHRIVGAALLDPTVHRTPRWYARHYLRRAIDSQRLQKFFTLEHPAWKNLRNLRALISRQTQDKERPDLFRTGLSEKQEIAVHIAEATGRGCHLFYGFTGGWEDYYNYPDQLRELYPDLIQPPHVLVRHYPETGHTFKSAEHRQRLIDDLIHWFDQVDHHISSSRP